MIPLVSDTETLEHLETIAHQRKESICLISIFHKRIFYQNHQSFPEPQRNCAEFDGRRKWQITICLPGVPYEVKPLIKKTRLFRFFKRNLNKILLFRELFLWLISPKVCFQKPLKLGIGFAFNYLTFVSSDCQSCEIEIDCYRKK